MVALANKEMRYPKQNAAILQMATFEDDLEATGYIKTLAVTALLVIF